MSSKYSAELEELKENTSHGIILNSIAPGSSVLECGCASGYMTRYMKEKLQAHVSIVEFGESDYEQARQFAEDGICANLEGQEWSTYYQEKQFDYILFADVLEHLHNPDNVLKRAAALLKEDGTMIVSVPNITHADILINLLNDQWNYMPLGILDDTHVHFWGEKNLHDLFLRAGLTVTDKEYVILPAYTTEQKSTDRTDGLMPAIYSICQRRFSDVYQFVYFARKESYAQKKGILCFDNYPECHWKYSAQPACCEEYKMEEEARKARYDAAIHALEGMSQTIQQLSQQVDMHLQERERLNNLLVTAEQERERLNNQLVTAEQERERLNNLLVNAELEHEALARQIALVQDEYNALLTQQGELREQNAQLMRRNAQLQQQYDYKAEEFNSISNAFFWKATKPFRATLDVVKSAIHFRKPPKARQTPAGAPRFYEPGSPMTILCTWHTLFVGRLIQAALKRAGIEARILTEEPEVYGDEVHIVICPQIFKKMPGRYIAFQMEQTISSRWLTEEYFDRLRNAYASLDYSLVNIRYFRGADDFGRNFYYLPIDYLPGMAREAEDYEYDVVFYGDPNCPRRKQFLEALQERFSVKVLSEVFGEELYEELSKAKIVVNIHYYANAMLETTRLYELLSLGRSVIVSERSSDPGEETRLEDFVDFVSDSQIEEMVERINYWLSHEEERLAAVAQHNEQLSQRTSAFDYYFLRFLLAQDWISFDRFYEQVGDFIQFKGNRVCLSLPESVDRREEFDRENRFGFEVFPGLRHARGWTGCGLSYKFIMKKAQEQQLENILVCEDDVLFPDDFDERWEKCMRYLAEHKDWDIFQGLMADVGKVKLSRVDHEYGETFAYLDRMISMVFNYYHQSVYPALIAWDETNDDVQSNTIDRALEAMTLRIITTVPFLVGHKEDLFSVIWGFQNTQYHDWISKSSEKLAKLVEKFEADQSHKS